MLYLEVGDFCNYKKAAQWLEKASSQGIEGAHRTLGRIDQKGLLGQVDRKRQKSSTNRLLSMDAHSRPNDSESFVKKVLTFRVHKNSTLGQQKGAMLGRRQNSLVF